ncbi:MAG: SNF2-related protein, partial [Bacteroidota bacterium]
MPFDLVYTLINHPYLGFVLEPHVVQVNSLGNFTLTHQRIFSRTSGYFSKKISETDMELITILDELDDDFLFKKFYTTGKKKIRTAEFFEKHCSPELFNEEIRPYIEERLLKVLNRLRGKVVYKMGNDNNPTSQKIEVSDEKASVLFHFRRDAEGTRYFPTIKYKGERIEFMFKNAAIISMQPAWMLLNNQLFNFVKDVDGKKLQPFLNKRFIQIAKTAEETYFTKFVTHLVEKYDVYAEGFTIQTKPVEGRAVLSVVPYQGEQITLKLAFVYGKVSFDYGTQNQVSATVQKHGNDYTFVRFRRDIEWEDQQKECIEKLDLKLLQAPFFGLKNAPPQSAGKELIPVETTNRYEFLEWLNEHNETLKKHQIDIDQAQEFNKYFIGHREIKLEVNERSDWFDVKATVKFGQYEFSFMALKEYILKGKREFILPNGLIAIIPPEWFGNLAGMLEFSTSPDEILIEKYHVGLIEELSHGGKYLSLSDKLEKIKNYGQVKSKPMPVAFEGELRPYQKAGYDWFYFLKENGFGGCLADDMGLGKTIQTLAMLQNEKEAYVQAKTALPNATETTLAVKPQLDLFDHAAVGSPAVPLVSGGNVQVAPAHEQQPIYIKTSLIVVPNSLVYNWYNEARKFTPHLKVLIYTGINREKNPQLFIQYDLIITTYGTVRVDVDLIKQFRFNYIILDESQSIKNPQSLAARAVKQLRSAQKLVLTGTPIENSVQELWSQLAFINPGLVGSLQHFTERFVTPIERGKDVNRLRQLKAIIKPFVLRR